MSQNEPRPAVDQSIADDGSLSTDCRICSNIIEQGNDTEKECWDEILVEDDNFVCTPTVGALVEGYVLTIPKNHAICSGELSSELIEEYWEFTTDVANKIEDSCGQTIIFEHGPNNSNTQVGCGVDHAHLHIVPFKEPVIDEVNQINSSPIQWHSIDNIQEVKHTYESGEEYLLFRNQSGDLMLGTSLTISSQLFRRAIATINGCPEKFDWNSHPFKSNVESTVECFNHSLKI